METMMTTQGRARRAIRRQARRARARVAAAFRKMVRGVRDKTAFARTIAFYRSGGMQWSKQLG
jgi:hypothetical protein